MSVPLLATHRLEFNYLVDGYPHKTRLYCDAVGGAPPYDIALRNGVDTITAQEAVDSFCTVLAGILPSATASFGDAVLERNDAPVWTPIEFVTSGAAPASGAAYIPAEQVTVSLRDTANHPVRVIVLEANVTVGKKSVNPGSTWDAELTTLTQWLTSAVSGSTDEGYNWVMSRGAYFLSSFVSVVTDLNDKIRRGRHIS